MNLHSGGELVTLADLEIMSTPEPTSTHYPLAHMELVRMVKYALGYYGHDVIEEHHAIDKAGDRYFGVLSLRSEYGDYSDMLGLRNSHDRTFPIGIAFGSSVHVCSNLAFSADHVIRRKHTLNSKRDLPGLVAEIIEPLRKQRIAQAQSFDLYKHTALTDDQLHDGIMRMYRNEIINVTGIAHVLDAYEQPPHDWGCPSAWRLFNAATFALRGKVAENPANTAKLHKIIDGLCMAA